MARYFRSKVDWWFYLVIGAVALSLASSAYMVITVEPQEAAQALPVLAIAALFAIGLPLWLLFSTGYTLDSTQLRIRSGPFSWTVPLADIRSIAPTHNPLSSPALSLDRLRIEHAGGSVMISPADKEGFLRELEALRAQLPGSPVR